MIERGDHRYDLMKNLFADNVSLITVRRVEAGDANHFFCSKVPLVLHSTSAKESNFVFPLYLYSEGLFGVEKRANISEEYLAELAAIVGEVPSPESVFGFVYATLHSPHYRSRFAAFLKTDFPRVPLPTSSTRFRELADWGAQLVALHTLDSQSAPVLREKRHALSVGSDLVEKPRYDIGERKIYINATQSFDNVDAATYAFKIGGYTVADKWLSDRKGRVLSFEERRLYPQILVALAETRKVMAAIDAEL